jgi:hypothetical protein
MRLSMVMPVMSILVLGRRSLLTLLSEHMSTDTEKEKSLDESVIARITSPVRLIYFCVGRDRELSDERIGVQRSTSRCVVEDILYCAGRVAQNDSSGFVKDQMGGRS